MLFDSGGHVTSAMKLVELNLFVWILYYSREYYTNHKLKCVYEREARVNSGEAKNRPFVRRISA